MKDANQALRMVHPFLDNQYVVVEMGIIRPTKGLIAHDGKIFIRGWPRN